MIKFPVAHISCKTGLSTRQQGKLPKGPKPSGTPERLKHNDVTDYMITYQLLILVLDTLITFADNTSVFTQSMILNGGILHECIGTST